MPYFPITGMLSERHPFHADPPATTSPAAKVLTSGVTAPLLAGAVQGVMSYSIARAMGIAIPQARGFALALGAVTAVGQIASSWLRGYLDKAVALSSAPAPAAPTAAAPPVTVK